MGAHHFDRIDNSLRLLASPTLHEPSIIMAPDARSSNIILSAFSIFRESLFQNQQSRHSSLNEVALMKTSSWYTLCLNSQSLRTVDCFAPFLGRTGPEMRKQHIVVPLPPIG